MDEEDARLAARRHATSKLSSAEGLEAIATLGFRGEALASIAAVSRFELVTCGDEQAGGVRVALEGGREETVTRQGFPRGTRVTVRDLFFNTPARRKFLRTPATEFQHAQGLLAPICLAHPEVHFRLIHNGRAVFTLGRCPSLAERAHQLFGAGLAEGLAPVQGREGTLAWSGLLSLPSHGQSSRRWQYLFVNGRPVKNAGLNHAVYQAYRTLLMKDRHPAYVLHLQLDPREVDVNVHPAKSEVRLRNPALLHTVLADRLYKALLDAGRQVAFGAGGAARAGAGQIEFPAGVGEASLAGLPGLAPPPAARPRKASGPIRSAAGSSTSSRSAAPAASGRRRRPARRGWRGGCPRWGNWRARTSSRSAART
jgi:DNA mismatch repair protein MutL